MEHGNHKHSVVTTLHAASSGRTASCRTGMCSPVTHGISPSLDPIGQLNQRAPCLNGLSAAAEGRGWIIRSALLSSELDCYHVLTDVQYPLSVPVGVYVLVMAHGLCPASLE